MLMSLKFPYSERQFMMFHNGEEKKVNRLELHVPILQTVSNTVCILKLKLKVLDLGNLRVSPDDMGGCGHKSIMEPHAINI